jgi:hypothetical protein
MASEVSQIGSVYTPSGKVPAGVQAGQFGSAIPFYVNTGGNFGGTAVVNVPAPSLWRIEGLGGMTNASIYGTTLIDRVEVFYDAPGPAFSIAGTGQTHPNAYTKTGAYVYFPTPGLYQVFVDGAVTGYIRTTSGIQVGGTLFVNVDPAWANAVIAQDPPSGVISGQGLAIGVAAQKTFEPLIDPAGTWNMNGALRLHTIRATNIGANPGTYSIGAAPNANAHPIAAGATITLGPAELMLSTLTFFSTLGTTIYLSGAYR